MMKLTLTLPTTVDELREFTQACDTLGCDTLGLGLIESDIDTGDAPAFLLVGCSTALVPLIATESTFGAAPAEAAPAKVPGLTPKRTKRPAKKAGGASKRAGAKPAAGTVALSILTTIVDADGMVDGSYADVCKSACPTNAASAQTEIKKMETAGWIAAEREGRRIKRVAITTKGREVYARLTDGPKPEQAPSNVTTLPANPPQRTGHPALPRAAAPLPVGGIKEPAGGWR